MTSIPKTISNTYELFFDGASKGNPGKAGAAAVIYKNADEVAYVSKYLGPKATNNEAEYNGLIFGLQLAIELGISGEIAAGTAVLTVKGDSQLVIKQMLGQYAVKNARMKVLWEQAKDLLKQIPVVTFMYVPRAQNARADALANEAIPLVPKKK